MSAPAGASCSHGNLVAPFCRQDGGARVPTLDSAEVPQRRRVRVFLASTVRGQLGFEGFHGRRAMAPRAIRIGAWRFHSAVVPLADAAATHHGTHAGIHSRDELRVFQADVQRSSCSVLTRRVQDACWSRSPYAISTAVPIAASPATMSHGASWPGSPLATASRRETPSSI